MLDTTLNTRVQVFLDQFEAALAAGDLGAAAAMFAAECYWRDLVAFTWNIKTMEGRDQIRDMLSSCLARAKPRNWKIADGEVATEAGGVTESWICFETEVAREYGLLRLQSGQIWNLLTTMVELKGHEEKAGFTRPLGARHGVNPGAKTWKELRDEETEQLGFTTQPYVLIIGEQRNMWKPTQQEGLWFHGGNLHQSRHYSQFLSLQLKARYEGIATPVYGLQPVHHKA